MYVLVSVLVLITCILLVLVILVQNSKGGGLASNFSSSNQIMGVRKTTDFLEKTTWTLAIVLLFLSLFSIFVIPKNNTANVKKSEAELYLDDNPKAQPMNYQPNQSQEEKAE